MYNIYKEKKYCEDETENTTENKHPDTKLFNFQPLNFCFEP